MKRTFLTAIFCLAAGMAQAGGLVAGQDVTGTAMIAGIEVAKNQYLVTPKPGYVHLLWNAFPYQAAIKGAGKAFSFEAAATDLAKGPGLEASPKAKVFRVDLVEFPEKDNYGAPRWDKIQFLGKFEVTLKGKKWSIKKRS